jgi:hypothetical protein
MGEVGIATVIFEESDQRQRGEARWSRRPMDVQSWLRKQLEQASPDLLRAMVQDFAEALMGGGGERALWCTVRGALAR